jgi:hypothetical protein
VQWDGDWIDDRLRFFSSRNFGMDDLTDDEHEQIRQKIRSTVDPAVIALAVYESRQGGTE